MKRNLSRLLALVIVICMLISQVNIPVSAADGPVFAGGSGTIEDPYQISTAEQLNEIRNYAIMHFILISDIS